MTVAVPNDAALAKFDDNIGMEDITTADLAIPRIQIVQKEGLFRDSLSNETFPVLNCVLLGVVKQRVMWHPVVDDGDRPMCKSPDNEHGFPNQSDEQPKEKRFPWAKSNFDPGNFPADKGINGLVTLPCASCKFTEWDRVESKPPSCSEQHTYPLFYTTDEGASWSPGILTLQKTGIKPSKNYISSFHAARKPMFTVETQITLAVSTRGAVTYSVPKLIKRGQSNPDMWEEYGQTYLRVRDVIRSAPQPRTEEDDTAPAESDNTNKPPEQAAAAPAAPATPEAPKAEPAPAATPAPAPAQATAPAPADDASDMPF